MYEVLASSSTSLRDNISLQKKFLAASFGSGARRLRVNEETALQLSYQSNPNIDSLKPGFRSSNRNRIRLRSISSAMTKRFHQVARVLLLTRSQLHSLLSSAVTNRRITTEGRKDRTMRSMGNPFTDYSPEMEQFEYEQSFGELPGVFSEAQEMQLASELLEISNEQELEQFLGDLISKAGKAIGGFVKSPIGQAIGGVLKSAAKVALPIAGGALGTFPGGPIGTSIGSSLGSMAGQALGLELEGLSPEDKEFETARQFVKFAGETVKNALQAPESIDTLTVARGAAAKAALDYAPGLANYDFGGERHRHHHRHRRGAWRRHGNEIVLFGV
jgi:hypothetical protein